MAGSADMHRDFDTFIGVDLGGGRGKNTAVALLARTRPRAPGDDEVVRVRYVGRRDPTGQPFHDDRLLAFVAAHGKGALLAIDAPLTRTVCVRCTLPSCVGLDACPDPVVEWFRGPGRALISDRIRTAAKPLTTPYTQRACEVVLHRRYGVLPREAFGQGMGPLTARAHYLRRALERDFTVDQNLIEVYPKATIHVLFGRERAQTYKRSVDTWRTRAEILEELGSVLRFEVWREGCLRDDHCFDAVICAYTAYLWARDGWELPEEHADVFTRDGWIWFPRPDEGGVIGDEAAAPPSGSAGSSSSADPSAPPGSAGKELKQ